MWVGLFLLTFIFFCFDFAALIFLLGLFCSLVSAICSLLAAIDEGELDCAFYISDVTVTIAVYNYINSKSKSLFESIKHGKKIFFASMSKMVFIKVSEKI